MSKKTVKAETPKKEWLPLNEVENGGLYVMANKPEATTIEHELVNIVRCDFGNGLQTKIYTQNLEQEINPIITNHSLFKKV